jgi:hypothetical protein
MDDMTQHFVAALDELHRSRDVVPLVDLFGDGATLDKAGMPHSHHGKDGARTFWQQYREVFDDIDASFRHRVDGDEVAFLEWTSEGTLLSRVCAVHTHARPVAGSGSWPRPHSLIGCRQTSLSSG